jgi:signal transduction histidine kinase
LLIRLRPFLTSFLLFLVPLLLLTLVHYWSAVKSAEAHRDKTLQQDLSRFSFALNKILDEHAAELAALADSKILQRYLSAVGTSSAEQIAVSQSPGGQEQTASGIPLELRASLATILNSRTHTQRVITFDRQRRPVFVIEPAKNQVELPVVRPFLQGMPQPEESVWRAPRATVVFSPLSTSASSGASLLCQVPVHLTENGDGAHAALVSQLNVDSILAEAAKTVEGKDEANAFGSMVIVLDRSGKILYHPNESLRHQAVSTALPSFTLAPAMTANQSGTQSFRMSNEQDYVGRFMPLERLNAAVAVAQQRIPDGSARRFALIEVLLSFLIASLAAFLIVRYWKHQSRGIDQVTEGVAAIAKGQLDRNIVVRSGDEARVIADNINLMTERMREQIAREAEARQFDSFVRLSAMLTHDLKNAIEALSLIVGNMEVHFDNKEFRVDMMKSLTIATEKLKALVARISNPVTTLSGEHKMPRPTDLVASLKRVFSLVVEPVRSKYQVELKLPPTLCALADGERIERVIENLVINALESMGDKGGKLTVEAGDVGPGKVFVSISDTGIGMSAEFLEHRLFRPFSTTKRSGVGLGLYTCREVVRANAGAIEVESKQGVGTTFRIVLPSATIEGRNQPA